MENINEMVSEQNNNCNKFRRKLLSILPVIFVIIVIICLYVIYTYYHIVPLISENENIGIIEVIIFNILVLMTLICFILSIITKPGEIPNTPEWSLKNMNENNGINSKELKSNGERRYCKWCGKYKPDRTHHCRVCKKCVLKMDHHCPWISNCVGWGNHKYLLLLILYSAITSTFITITLAPTLNKALNMDLIQFGDIVALLLAEILSAFLVVILFSFFSFHLWLVFNSMTTIEFCEKSNRNNNQTNLWFKGYFHSFTQVFGSNPFLWIFPIGNQIGDGINFEYRNELDNIQGYNNNININNDNKNNNNNDNINNSFKDSNVNYDLNSNIIVDYQSKILDESSLLLNSKDSEISSIKDNI